MWKRRPRLWSVRTGGVRWLLEHIPFSKEELEQVISLAVNGPGGSLVSELMDQKRKQGSVKRRRFQL